MLQNITCQKENIIWEKKYKCQVYKLATNNLNKKLKVSKC